MKKYTKYVYTFNFEILDEHDNIITKDLNFESLSCLFNQMVRLYEKYNGRPVMLSGFGRSKYFDN